MMNPRIEEQVIVFYNDLFQRIFSRPFQRQIPELLRRKAMGRQVEEAADASSRSLLRFFVNERLPAKAVTDILGQLERLGELLKLLDIENARMAPGSLAQKLLKDLPCPGSIDQPKQAAAYRLSLHLVVQVLLLTGPVMGEWQKLNFSSKFGMLDRVVDELNRISAQLDALGRSGREAGDDRYELSYRDYLLQRFYQVEAGTVKMTTHLNVDLRELFVEPCLRVRAQSGKSRSGGALSEADLMDLAMARDFFRKGSPSDSLKKEKQERISLLEYIRDRARGVIIGAPGSGKSTALEWLQLQLAGAYLDLRFNGGQAIPLLLRLRQLDPEDLPRGPALIEKATASADQAAITPPGWVERHMETGRVLFMLDGLDEIEPELRDRRVLPWLEQLCRDYPDCRYLVSSRPVGYPPALLAKLDFKESELLDFDENQIGEYTSHWCTSVRLARNEPEEEARREGEKDGAKIHDDFKSHPYINNLARNPLMLSAICLVNYFEGGQLPEDRAKLYELCVEGLLHNWDQRRGIHSEFSLSEKLRACRETALAMQASDRAEYEDARVEEIFISALDNPRRGQRLMEHIRYRAGLLLERRPGAFAFAHLTFQEYLAALAVHEGNDSSVDIAQLIQEHNDGRWQEVIPLYCGLSPARDAKVALENLIDQPDTRKLSLVLGEAYLAAGAELARGRTLRERVLRRIAVAPDNRILHKFPSDEVAPIANQMIGRMKSSMSISEAYRWLYENPEYQNIELIADRLKEWEKMNPAALGELINILHCFGPDSALMKIASLSELYSAPGPDFGKRANYGSQAEVAFVGLRDREQNLPGSPGIDAALLQILRTMSIRILMSGRFGMDEFLLREDAEYIPHDSSTWPEYATLARKVAHRYEEKPGSSNRDAKVLKKWADLLEKKISEGIPEGTS